MFLSILFSRGTRYGRSDEPTSAPLVEHQLVMDDEVEQIRNAVLPTVRRTIEYASSFNTESFYNGATKALDIIIPLFQNVLRKYIADAACSQNELRQIKEQLANKF